MEWLPCTSAMGLDCSSRAPDRSPLLPEHGLRVVPSVGRVHRKKVPDSRSEQAEQGWPDGHWKAVAPPSLWSMWQRRGLVGSADDGPMIWLLSTGNLCARADLLENFLKFRFPNQVF